MRLAIEQERAGGKQQCAGADQQHPGAATADACGEQPSTSGSASDPVDAEAAAHQPALQSPAGTAAGAGAGAATAAQGAGSLAQQAEQPEAAAAGGSLDIRDLSWVDRERVLRLLFAKINGKAAERRAAALPAHPLDAAAAQAAAAAAAAAGEGCCGQQSQAREGTGAGSCSSFDRGC